MSFVTREQRLQAALTTAEAWSGHEQRPIESAAVILAKEVRELQEAADAHELAALIFARSNNTEDTLTAHIPQEVYDSLYERKLLRIAGEQFGECYAVPTDAGIARIIELLEHRR